MNHEVINDLDVVGNITSNIQKAHHVKKQELPVCCPTKTVPLWSAHPRVYLPLDAHHREAICPYCDAEFILVD